MNAELAGLLDHYRAYLHLPDLSPVLAALGTVAANRLAGDPVWSMLVGPPSCGKSEIIDSLRLVGEATSLSTLTKAALLSGSTGGAGGLLLTRFAAGPGLLLVKDFTTILSEAAGARTEVVALLREVFDGHVERATGTRDTPLAWSGKVGLLAGVTEEIESHRSVIALMGERFVYFPLAHEPEARVAMATRAMANSGRHPRLRKALAEAVAGYFNALGLPAEPVPIERGDAAWLVDAADLGSRARSVVLRGRGEGEITLVPDPELPARLVGEFAQLWRGLACIGADAAEARRLLHQAMLAGIPKLRRLALVVALDAAAPLSTVGVALALRTPRASVQRVLEDLTALGVLDCEEHQGPGEADCYWAPTPTIATRWARLAASPPTRSEAAGADHTAPTLAADAAPGSVLSGPEGELRRRGGSGPCRICGQGAWLADDLGPIHPACLGATS